MTTTLGAYVATGDWATALQQANSDLAEHVDSDEAEGPMATTVVAVAVYAAQGGWRVDAACLGDSELWHLDADQKWIRLLPPVVRATEAAAELFDGRTRALPTTVPQPWQWSGEVASGALFLMSDGVGLPLAMSTEVEETLATWWATPPPALDFAAQVGFARMSFMDDRTVVGLWPTELQVDTNPSPVV